MEVECVNNSMKTIAKNEGKRYLITARITYVRTLHHHRNHAISYPVSDKQFYYIIYK